VFPGPPLNDLTKDDSLCITTRYTCVNSRSDDRIKASAANRAELYQVGAGDVAGMLEVKGFKDEIYEKSL
jgi:hypothetical protein